MECDLLIATVFYNNSINPPSKSPFQSKQWDKTVCVCAVCRLHIYTDEIENQKCRIIPSIYHLEFCNESIHMWCALYFRDDPTLFTIQYAVDAIDINFKKLLLLMISMLEMSPFDENVVVCIPLVGFEWVNRFSHYIIHIIFITIPPYYRID